MNGIKMSDCKFYVNKWTRTVVCVIPNTKFMVHDFINDHFNFNCFDFTIYGKKMYRAMVMPNSFRGKAVCAEGDTWNEELGKMIAFSRARDKCYESFFKRMRQYINTLDFKLEDMVATVNQFGAKISSKKHELEAQIEEKLQ